VHRPAQVFHARDAMVVEEQLPLRWGNHEFSWLGSNGSWTGNQQAAGTPHNTDQQQADKQSFHGSTFSSQLRESSWLNHNHSPPLLPQTPPPIRHGCFHRIKLDQQIIQPTNL